MKHYKIILVSKSPRRKQLLSALGLKFNAVAVDIEEEIPPGLKGEEIALVLAERKATAYDKALDHNTLIIAADTLVWLDGVCFGKPSDYNEAVCMLRQLSGKMHEVITGVCIRHSRGRKSFFAVSKVYFKKLTDDEINYYVNNFKPYDKAGSYGIQEWIGLAAVEKIEGSSFNVMGLPLKELYEELQVFL